MEWLIAESIDFLILMQDFLDSKEILGIILLILPLLLIDIPRYLIAKLVYVFFKQEKSEMKYRQFRSEARTLLFSENPLVTVLIPVLNEESTIGNTIRSLQEQTFSNLEIIITDDDSQDKTYQICREFAKRGEIKLIRNNPRGGKSAALNHAFTMATGKYVVVIDSDTLFKRDAIENLLLPFHDEDIGAVGGNLRILNGRFNVLAALQNLEYLISISAGRRIRASVDSLYIISGAFGAYRYDLLKSIKGYSVGPGEDSDATAKIRKKHYRISFAPEAICYTKVPTSYFAFIKQRFRWNTSTIKIKLKKHSNILNPTWDIFSFPNALGWLDVIFFQVVVTFSFIFYIVFTFEYFSNTIFIVLFIVIHLMYILITYIETFIAWALSGRQTEDVHLYLYVPLYPFYKAYFLKLIRLSAYLGEVSFKASYSLDFVPKRVRKKAERW
ncbi:MAG: glycosyltransferase [Candidatus Cloacimonetes bacterium]|nr:glycosyltransferase [Candidatus Cloacimonadota bacterium]